MDKELKKRMERQLLTLEKTNDWIGDTPKRHKISELIRDIRVALNAPTTKGYEP